MLGASRDGAAQRLSLQSLELLGLENSDTICAQPQLLDLLLALPSNAPDAETGMLVAKLILYFAENQHVCEYPYEL